MWTQWTAMPNEDGSEIVLVRTTHEPMKATKTEHVAALSRREADQLVADLNAAMAADR